MTQKKTGKRALRAPLSPASHKNRSSSQEDPSAEYPDALAGDYEFIDYRDADLLEKALAALLKQANRPLQMDELLRIARLPRKAKKYVEKALYGLQENGRVLRASGGWAAASGLKHVEGVLAVQRAGMGFVTPSTGKGPDIYIHPTAMSDAWHGDTVEVLLMPGKRGPNLEGRITRVIHRSLTELPVHATRRQKDGTWMCTPSNPRVQALFITDVSGLAKPVEEDNLLLVTPGEKTGPGLWTAKATANLEHEESPSAQERVTKSNHSIPSAFPPAVIAQSSGLPEDPQEAEFADRHDLRGTAFVTIDGKTARDFDDAIYVEPSGKGFRLMVAIADVSHYVHEDSALDAEARLRGNSYYFPMSVEPMLPEALSNGLCSLRPDVPRLAMVADMQFSANGQVNGAKFYPAVIKSKARLTYGQIQRGLLLNEPEEQKNLAPVLSMLRDAEALARQIMALRAQRGSLDFDLPEAEIGINEAGEITHVTPRERHFGHKLIEEFMIAANEAVARFLTEKSQPALYRVHPAPDPEKLTNLVEFLAQTGLGENPITAKQQASRGKGNKAPVLPTAHDLRRIMESATGTPQEYMVNRMVLRSMMQAKYTPENEGHFGLASTCYCHFTSPIRRYADLVVHRALRAALGLPAKSGEKTPSVARLEDIANHINGTERTAMEAEREINKRLIVLYLRDKVGEVYDGIVSGVTDFGMFVELPSLMAEGMIRLNTLDDDYYEFIQERQELRGKRTRRTFRLGQKLRVLLTDVNLARLETNLVLEGSTATPGAGRSRSGITVTGRKSRTEEAREQPHSERRSARGRVAGRPTAAAGADSPGKRPAKGKRKNVAARKKK